MTRRIACWRCGEAVRPESTLYRFGSTWMCADCLKAIVAKCDAGFLADMMSLRMETAGNLADRLSQTVEVGA